MDDPVTADEVLAAFEARMEQRLDLGVVNRALNVFLEPQEPFRARTNAQAEDGSRHIRNALCRRGGGIPVLQSRRAAAAGVPMSNTGKRASTEHCAEGGCWAVLHHRAAHRRRVLLCVLAESNPDSRRTERGIRVHRSAAVVSEAALRSDAAAHDPGGSVVFRSAGGSGICGKREPTTGSWEKAIQSVKQRVKTTTSVAALTGV